MKRIITTSDLTDEEWNEDKSLEDDQVFSDHHTKILNRNDERQAEARATVIHEISAKWKAINMPIRESGKVANQEYH